MDRTPATPDERLNQLVDEIARLTGEDYVTTMCRALEERRERLVAGDRSGRPVRLLRLSLEAEIPEDADIEVRKSLTNIDDPGR